VVWDSKNRPRLSFKETKLYHAVFNGVIQYFKMTKVEYETILANVRHKHPQMKDFPDNWDKQLYDEGEGGDKDIADEDKDEDAEDDDDEEDDGDEDGDKDIEDEDKDEDSEDDDDEEDDGDEDQGDDIEDEDADDDDDGVDDEQDGEFEEDDESQYPEHDLENGIHYTLVDPLLWTKQHKCKLREPPRKKRSINNISTAMVTKETGTERRSNRAKRPNQKYI